MTKYSEYLYESAGTRQISDLIAGTEIQHSSMSRYLNGHRPMPVSVVVTMSRKYSLPLLDGMVAADYITEADLERERSRYGLGTMSDQDLSAEILRRLEAAADSQLAVEMKAPVSDFAPVRDLGARRRNLPNSQVYEAAKEEQPDVPEDTP